jgi:phosphate transport system substrate-binding protein
MLRSKPHRWVGLLMATVLIVSALVTFAGQCGTASPTATPAQAPTTAPAAGPTDTSAGVAPTTAPTSVAPTTPLAAGDIALNGAGATFPFPIYSKWFSEYGTIYPNIKINYQSIGSGGGIKNITDKTVDFGATDAPMSDDELKAAPAEILHIPTVLGAVVVSYNVQGVDTGLKLSSDVLAGIFLGEITKWSDPKIAADNPGVTFPDEDIVVAHRSDSSGTTNIFTDYLSNANASWKEKVGKGKAVEWPVGLGGKGNEGVAGLITQNPGSIGYVELAYAVQNKLPYASIKNQAGQFIVPSVESTTAGAAASASSMPKDFRVSIVNAPGNDSYPIAAYTYLLVYKEQTDAVKGKALVDFLWWSIHDGQKDASGLLYAPLPSEVVTMAESAVNSITYQGTALRSGS